MAAFVNPTYIFVADPLFPGWLNFWPAWGTLEKLADEAAHE